MDSGLGTVQGIAPLHNRVTPPHEVLYLAVELGLKCHSAVEYFTIFVIINLDEIKLLSRAGMARAVSARMQGDDYQARFFWLQICRLFQSHTKVMSVGYEVPDAKSFDDVVVSYQPAVNDGRGGLVSTDYFQVKFHVSQDEAVRFDSLLSPEFIGATKFSFLQRLRDAYIKTKETGNCRFTLVTPWGIVPEDPLARLINNNAGQLHLNRLFDPGPGTRMGKLRRQAAEHLDVDEETLHEILAAMRVLHSFDNLGTLNDRLNDKLVSVGMRPIEDTGSYNPYDDLAKKLLQSGRQVFTADQIREICEQEGLWVGRRDLDHESADLGIRSFLRWAEYMEDETDAVLDLVQYFDGRKIQDPVLWNGEVAHQVVQFLETNTKAGGSFRLRVDAHTSIAVLAGYTLEAKAGVKVSLVQRTRSGVQIWNTEEPATLQESEWEFDWIGGDVTDGDLAVAVGVTHDVRRDVAAFVNGASIPIRGTLVATPPRAGNTVVRDGPHALALAQALVAKLRELRKSGQTVHLFMAAPNGFSFVLGQHLRPIGPAVVYEFDFESGVPGAYQAGVALPPARMR